MTEQNNQKVKEQKQKIAKAVEKEEKTEDKVVEQEVKKVEKGKETVKQAEEKVAKEITKEADKLEEKKEKVEEKISEIKEKTKDSSESSEKLDDISKDRRSSLAKPAVEPVSKKTEAVVNGRDLRISTKQAIAIGNFIKNKDVDKALAELEEVVKMKRAIPMKGEIPHRHGKMMSGRYPIKAVKEFIRLLKSLKANAIANELELEKFKLAVMVNVAARPYKRFGRERFKRSHVQVRLIKRVKVKKRKEKRK